MSDQIPKFDFIDFVEKFPLVEMPVTLGEDTHHTFSMENNPLPQAFVDQYIAPFEAVEPDEFTEYIPCFSIDCEEEYVLLVWWKAGLLTYQYYLGTFTEKGKAIDRKVIAFTAINGDQIKRAVATIDGELSIHIAEGISVNDIYDPLSSLTRLMEILPNGIIVAG